MTDLPPSWCAAPLSELCERIVDGSHNPPKGLEFGYAMLSARNVVNQKIIFDDFRWISSADFDIENARTSIKSGDVLLTIVGTIGRTAVVPVSVQKFTLQRSVAVLKPLALAPKYLSYCLESPPQQKWLLDNAKGTAQKGVYLKVLGTAQIPLAPPSEQNRIVDKLEELLSDLDAGVTELKTAQRKLVQYRQSLLKAAVDGTLTAEWRAARAKSGEPQETGAELLQRILTARRAGWEAKQLAKFAEQDKTPPRNWQAKYPKPIAPETSDLPAIPEGWAWATIDQLAHVGTGVTPLRSKRAYFDGGTIPWTTSGALNDEVVSSASEHVTRLAIDECRLELYPAGSLLVAMYGEGKTRGKCSELAFPSTINQAIAAIVFNDLAITVRTHVKTFLLDAYEAMRKQASGGVQPNLNLQIIKSLPVPLPPSSEQHEIQMQMGEQLANYSEIEAEVRRSLVRSNAQRKNILKAAFAGQLVPQDPDDEPASVLLARIRAERVAAGAKRVGKSARKTRERR